MEIFPSSLLTSIKLSIQKRGERGCNASISTRRQTLHLLVTGAKGELGSGSLEVLGFSRE